ncbi:MAG TPA: cation:proton antiporter [Terriglobales bacterium]|nr:cation:proton antiporter [Terriglobales bacterium]
MYSIGLEFSFRDLFRVTWVAIIGGPLGVLLSVALALGVGSLLGWSWQQGVAIGAIVSVASTMVLSRFLTERGPLRSEQRQVMIGITLVEDLAVVMLTILLPSLGDITGGKLLALGMAMGKALLILNPVTFLAHKLVPPLRQRVMQIANPEFLVLVALALGFVTAALTHAVGLSLALGAFLAGLLASESAAHETMKHLLALRDAFVALFFVTMGILVVIGKFVVWTAVVKLFRSPTRTALMVGIGLTQIGEFSYVRVRVRRDAHIVGDDLYNPTLAASVVTILANGLLIRFVPNRIAARDTAN